MPCIWLAAVTADSNLASTSKSVLAAFCMIRTALLVVHASWLEPPGTINCALVPVMFNDPPAGFTSVHTDAFKVEEKKSSDTGPVLAQAAVVKVALVEAALL